MIIIEEQFENLPAYSKNFLITLWKDKPVAWIVSRFMCIEKLLGLTAPFIPLANYRQPIYGRHNIQHETHADYRGAVTGPSIDPWPEGRGTKRFSHSLLDPISGYTVTEAMWKKSEKSRLGTVRLRTTTVRDWFIAVVVDFISLYRPPIPSLLFETLYYEHILFLYFRKTVSWKG